MSRDQRIGVASLVFFLSGGSALVFETIWFRVTSIVLGSSVWSAAAVLMAFMAGLGLGNALMMARGQRITRVFRFYVFVELTIGISGVGIVILLPALAPWASGLFGAVLEQHSLLTAARFAVAFCVLLVPAIAMGTTLPVMVKGLHEIDRSFSAALGRLYGWNTIGAVAGVIVAEFLLIDIFGIRNTALFAALLNLSAALLVMKRFKIDQPCAERAATTRSHIATPRLLLLLLAPFLVGGVLLALEVVWFRYLLLAHDGTSVVFATMLAVVLAGIGIGGLIGTRLKLAGRKLDARLAGLLIIGAFTVVASFYLANLIYDRWFIELTRKLSMFLLMACVLMLPTSVVSGVLFPLLGEKLHRSLAVTTRTSGVLTLANTSGAAIGSGIATFVLLPALGIEKSILLLCYGYVIAALMLLSSGTLGIAPRRLLAGLTLTAVLLPVIYPHHSLERAYKTFASRMFPGEKLVFVREGLNETLQYLRMDLLDRPLMYRLVTNGFSMSGTSFHSQRYMKFFVYFPHLLNPDIRDVLLISYGVGNTAEAIASLPQVDRYDIVDISRDVLSFSGIIHGQDGRHPLHDPRARIHVEDGRFFLQTTRRRFDLITGEPPPPRNAGVVNLYTREYFRLMEERLNPGGVVTYWLPSQDLTDAGTLAIIKAFCLVFEDCSLWAPAGLDFVLLGSRDGLRPVDAATLERVWDSPIAAEFAAIGYENPSQFLTNFVADAATLAGLAGDVPPVTDDYPNRILSGSIRELGRFSPLYAELLDDRRRSQAFWASAYIRSLFSVATMQVAMNHFQYEKMYTGILVPRYMRFDPPDWDELIGVLRNTDFEVLPAMALGATPVELSIADATSSSSGRIELLRAKRLLSRRAYREAAELIGARVQPKDDPERQFLGQLALIAAGLHGAASGSWSEFESLASSSQVDETFKEWLRARLGIPVSN